MSTEDAAPTEGGLLRVLLVEDREADAKLVAHELRKLGRRLELRRVETEPAMRTALDQEPWDLVISDWSMPRFSAQGALQVLKDRQADLPFIIVSGTVGEPMAVEAMRAGAHDYVLKDHLARLIPAIERELREKRVRDERKAAHRALLESEARYRRIVETNNQGVWMLDAEGRTTFMNARLARMLGCDRDEVVGVLAISFVDEAHRDEAARAFARRTAVQIESHLRTRDGSSLWVLLETTPLSNEAGGYEGAFAMVMDVSARRKAEEDLVRVQAQLRQAQKMEAIGRFAGGVAHDMNNMLGIIVAHTQFLSEALAPGDPRRGDVISIREASDRGAALARQLLSFSRQQILTPSLLDLSEVVANAVKLIRPLIGEDIDVRCSLAPVPVCVKADPGQLEQVVMNLAVNARDAMPRGGSLTLETELAGERARLRVSDTGTGMDASTRERLFEPFFTTKEPGKGTGLGLATVFGIVKQSGGEISVDTAEGRGASFLIELPVAGDPVATAPARRKAPVDALGTETILLVEDNLPLRTAIARTLRTRGYRVLEAASGVEALERWEASGEAIDLIVTDVVLPGLSGPEAVQRMRDRLPRLKALFMSGYADTSDHVQVPTGGAPFLQKPFAPAALAASVRAALDD